MTTSNTPTSLYEADFMQWVETRGGNAVKLDYSSNSPFHGHRPTEVVRSFLNEVMNYVEGTDYIIQCFGSCSMVRILTWTKKGNYDIDVRPNDCVALLEDR